MKVEIRIGDEVVEGRLPLMPARFVLVDAHTVALGLQEDESGEWVTDESGNPAIDMDVDELAVVRVAALGACLPRGFIDVRSLAKHNHDVLAYGDAVFAALLARGYHYIDIVNAGGKVYRRIRDSLPTVARIEEEAGNSKAPAEGSTATTS